MVVLDEQCIRTDAFQEAELVKAPVIAASEKNCMGFKDRTEDDPDAIVADLVSGKVQIGTGQFRVQCRGHETYRT